MEKERPLSVTLLVAWFLVLTVLSLFFGALLLKTLWYFTLVGLQLQSAYDVSISVGFIIFLFSPLFLVTAIGLHQMKIWSFYLAIVLLILTAPTIVSVIGLIYLFKNKDKFEE